MTTVSSARTAADVNRKTEKEETETDAKRMLKRMLPPGPDRNTGVAHADEMTRAHDSTCRHARKDLDCPAHPVRAKDRLQQAGLLASGSTRSPQPSRTIIRWRDRA